jgi:hypothetical protein
MVQRYFVKLYYTLSLSSPVADPEGSARSARPPPQIRDKHALFCTFARLYFTLRMKEIASFKFGEWVGNHCIPQISLLMTYLFAYKNE